MFFSEYLGETGVKLLGAPALPCKSADKQGELISTATYSLLNDKWKCVDCIKCMVFDTTSANTGK